MKICKRICIGILAIAFTSLLSSCQLVAIQYAVANKNVGVQFYGEVVDQHGDPVANAQINAVVRHWYETVPGVPDVKGEMISLAARTGTDGRFKLRGATGDVLEIKSIQKDQYELEPGKYNIAPVAGSMDAPVVFKMWRKGVSAQLVSQGIETRIPYDGTTVTFDLLTGQQCADTAAKGDLRIALRRWPLNLPAGHTKPFEWHVIVEAIGGGIIQAGDGLMYTAPEDGYQPRIQIDMPAEATNWSSICSMSLYAKTRGGSVYSRVKLEFRVNSSKPQTGFTITSAANPNGSRNLEP